MPAARLPPDRHVIVEWLQRLLDHLGSDRTVAGDKRGVTRGVNRTRVGATGTFFRGCPCRIEVVTAGHDLGAESRHCRVLVRVVALRDEDRAPHFEELRRMREGLSMISSCRRHQPTIPVSGVE
jgi:hypothetical protein